MDKLFRYSAAVALLLLLGVGTLVAQEVVFTPGPAVTPRSGASNGGFAWARCERRRYPGCLHSVRTILC